MAVVGSLALLLAGCALVGGPAPVPPPQPDLPAAPSESAPAEETAPVVPPFGVGYAPVDPSVLRAPDQEGLSWVSPSRNLKCGILDTGSGTLGEWGCTIGEKNWSFPTDSPDDFCYDAQTSCGWGIVGYADEVPNPRYNGGVLFSSEMDQGQYPVLAYGQSVTYLGVTCISSENGIQCQHATSAHGFLISRSDNLIY